MRFIQALVAAACVLSAASPIGAQTYPAKPIKVIVPYAAGQGTDILTRYLVDQLAKEVGQAIVVDNRPGAGGNLGTAVAAQAPADGYTLMTGTNATHVLNEYMFPKLAFSADKDFEPIALVGTFPMVLAVSASAPVESAAQLVTAVQGNARAFDIALPSTSARLVVELLKDQSKTPLVGVPYKGSGNAMTDLQGGQLRAIVDTPTALRPHLAAGKIRAIAVTSGRPSSLVPGVRTVAEQGFPGFEVIAWNALYAPKGTPPAVVTYLNTAVNKVLAKQDVRQRLLELGFEPAGGTPEQLRDFTRSEREKWGPLIQAAGMKAE